MYPRGSTVLTPLGPATIHGATADRSKYLVCFSKSDFSPEDWKNLSPANGPCVFRMMALDQPDEEEVEGTLIELTIGDTYANKKSGRRYLLLEAKEDKVRIRSLDSGDAWWTTFRSLRMSFEKVAGT